MKKSRGMTLVELLMALTLVAVVLGLAMPDMHDVLQGMAVSGATEEFLADLQLARSESLKRNRRVAMCKSADGRTCAQAGGWEQGWIVFHDDNNNAVVDGQEEVLTQRGALAQQLRFSGNQTVARYISFAPIGFTKLLNGGFQAGTLTMCPESAGPVRAKEIVLNALGRPRVQFANVPQCL